MTFRHDAATIALEEPAVAPSSEQTSQQREQFARNAAWFQAHAIEIASQHCGKCICVAGQQLFAADTAREALALATAAHPQDHGRFVHYIPQRSVPRIYAH